MKGLSAKRKEELTKAQKVVNAIFSAIIIAIFVIALAAMIYLLVQLTSGNSPNLFGYRFYFVLTGSMKPTLEPKDMILSKVIEDNSDVEYVRSMVREGDIITYTGKIGSNDAPITHRVIKGDDKDDVIYYDDELGQWMLITKGDNNSRADDPIPITKVSAVMVRKVNFISAIYNFVSTKAGGFVLIGIPVVLILLPFIFRIVLTAKQTDKDKEKESEEERRKKLEEEIARKAVEEYLASINKDKENNPPPDDKKPE